MKKFLAAVAVFTILGGLSVSLATLAQLKIPFVIAVFTLAVVSYLLADEVTSDEGG